jgi:hypothetical protein
MPNLTSKQLIFCDAIISGLNQSDSYKAAYDTVNMLPATISNNAYMLMNHSVIKANIQAKRDSISASVSLTKERAITEALINLSLARGLDQIGPANQSLKLAAEFSGITQSIQSSAQLVTQVTVVLNRATDTDTVAIEAQSVSLSEADDSLELGDGEE